MIDDAIERSTVECTLIKVDSCMMVDGIRMKDDGCVAMVMLRLMIHNGDFT